jgi:hypothetical protein
MHLSSPLCNGRQDHIYPEISRMKEQGRLTDAELWVLFIMATENVSLKKIKDAVQAIGSADKQSVLALLRDQLPV